MKMLLPEPMMKKMTTDEYFQMVIEIISFGLEIKI